MTCRHLIIIQSTPPVSKWNTLQFYSHCKDIKLLFNMYWIRWRIWTIGIKIDMPYESSVIAYITHNPIYSIVWKVECNIVFPSWDYTSNINTDTILLWCIAIHFFRYKYNQTIIILFNKYVIRECKMYNYFIYRC